MTLRAIVAVLTVAGSVLVSGCQPERPVPNVLLVTVDTLRADQLGTYGARSGSSPNVDAFAQASVVFERAIAASSRTAPSHASLFASRWVRDHSIGYTNGMTKLGSETTLAGLLSDAGYETAAFIGNAMLDRRLGLNSGFGYYDDRLPDSEANRTLFERVAEKTTLAASSWLANERTKPFFLWVQYNDPHGPYTPPSGYVVEPPAVDEHALPALIEHHGEGGIPAYQVFGDERSPSQYRARYSGEILYFDEWFGELLRATDRHRGGRETIVVLTADHGESLGEDDVWFAHGIATTPNLVHVPLVVRAPELEPGRVKSLVHHVDVVPTLLDLIGLAPLNGAAGLSLVPSATNGQPLPERTLYADTGNDVSAYRGNHFARKSLVEDDGRGAWRFSSNVWKSDGTWQEASVPEALVEDVRVYTEHRVPSLRAPRYDPTAEARLRALGYIEQTSSSRAAE